MVDALTSEIRCADVADWYRYRKLQDEVTLDQLVLVVVSIYCHGIRHTGGGHGWGGAVSAPEAIFTVEAT